VLRADEDLGDILDDPAEALSDRDELYERLKAPVRAAVLTLRRRRDQRIRNEEEDDYTVDFKNTEQLLAMRDSARESYLTLLEAATLE